MLIKVTTIGGVILVNTNIIVAVTPSTTKDMEGSLLWVSREDLPDSGYDGDDELLWIEESIDEIHALMEKK